MILLSSIKTNPNNPRLIKDERFKKLVQSIKDFPQMMELRPMIVDKDNIILGGNMRLKAIQELGMKEIPDSWVKKASDLTEEQKKEFIIKDNVGFGEWDWETLANAWDENDLKDWGLELPFKFGGDAEEDDYEIPDEIETDIIAGDLFEIGQHRLLCGDSTNADDVGKVMGGIKADMVFTDPPYGNNPKIGYGRTQLKGRFIANDENTDTAKLALRLAYAHLKNNSHFLSFIQWRTFSELEVEFKNLGLTVRSVIVWDKGNAGLGHGLVDQHEWIIVGIKGEAKQRFYTGNLWSINRVQTKREESEHPHKKPIGLLSKALDLCIAAKSLIYEPFLGSGSTMLSCHQTNRKCIGIEISPQYCQVIVDRMLKLDPNLEVKRNGKPYSKIVNNTGEKQVKYAVS